MSKKTQKLKVKQGHSGVVEVSVGSKTLNLKGRNTVTVPLEETRMWLDTGHFEPAPVPSKKGKKATEKAEKAEAADTGSEDAGQETESSQGAEEGAASDAGAEDENDKDGGKK